MKCPYCHIETRYIIQHIAKKVDCQKSIDIQEFKSQFQAFKTDHTSAFKRKIMQQSRTNQRAEDDGKVKIDQVKWKVASRIQQREKDECQVKEDQFKWKVSSRIQQGEKDECQVKEDQVKWNIKSMKKQRAENEGKK